MANFSYGSDPEFMLMKDGEYVSAIDVINGSVEEPIEDNGHSFYWDNVLAECAVKPSFDKLEALNNFQDCLKRYAKIVSPYSLIVQAAQNYPKQVLNDPKAKVAGCEADNCCYTMSVMKGELSAKDAIANGDLRTCGGHIHVGHDILLSDGPEPIFAVYLFDLFLGVPSLFLDKDITSSKRKEIYGQSGRFRNKEYGIEYRSLSNYWLQSPKLLELIYDITNFVIDFLEQDKAKNILSFNEDVFWSLITEGESTGEAFQFIDFDKQTLKNCIDNSDIIAGKKFMKIIKDHMPKALFEQIQKEVKNKKPYDFYKEWQLVA